jgi:protein associated with RNAse G/E
VSEAVEAATVRVVKRKWDGTVSAIDTAHPLLVPGDSSAWIVPAGSRRERPRKGTVDIVDCDEIWVAVPGEWWILCGYLDSTQTLNGYKVHASAPFEAPGSDEEITWVDLDLDFEVTGNELELLDEDEFHDHARTMAYPNHVVRGAWSGIATIAARYTNREWPFDGSMQEWVGGA